MGGLNFITPGFLMAGIAAMSVPLIIHLLLRQRAREVPIATVRFLKAVIQQHTRRKRIKQWILMALRMLAVLLLAMLFARPWLDRSHIDGLNTETVILIDRSASMQAGSLSGKSVFDSALETAQREIARLDENTLLHVGLYDASGVQEIDAAELDANPQPRDISSDHGLALAWARDIVLSSGRENREVVLISDLQQSGLDRTAVTRFPIDAELIVRDVGRALSENVAIESCRAMSTEIRPGEPIRIVVRLRNADALSVSDLDVVLALDGPDGEVTKTQAVTIEGSSLEVVEFELDLETDGLYSGSVSLDHEDDLAFDNRRRLAFEARHPDRLLLVDGDQGNSVYTNETYYIETALRLRMKGSESTQRSFEIERIVWDDGEGFPDLAGFRAVVLCNVGRLSDTDAGRLKDFVTSGGNLLFFCGDRTRPDQIDRLRTAELLDVSIARNPDAGRFRIIEWEKEHPIFVPFENSQNGDLRRLTFRRLIHLESIGESARVLISTEDGPLMIEQRTGSGTTLFVTTSADRDWSDWPRERLFVPLMRQMMAWLTGQLGTAAAVREETIAESGEKPGISKDGDQTVVRNVDPAESTTARVSEEDFRAAFNIASRNAAEVLKELAETVGTPPNAEKPNESWHTAMWILFAIMTAELLMSSRVHA